MLITREPSGDIVVTSDMPFSFYGIGRICQKILEEQGVDVRTWPVLVDTDEPDFRGYWILTFVDPADDYYLEHEELT